MTTAGKDCGDAYIDGYATATRASAETLADLERRLADCIVQGAGPAFDAVRAERESAETLAALRSALFDEYGINVVDEALLVAIASPSEMEVNRERWQAARDRLRAALAATPAEDDAKDAER